MIDFLKKFGLVLLAGVIACFIFGAWLIGLSLLAEVAKAQNYFEFGLIVGAFLKPIGLVLLGSWLWLSGKFLNTSKPKTTGRWMLIIYCVIPIAAYLFSFTVTPNN